MRVGTKSKKAHTPGKDGQEGDVTFDVSRGDLQTYSQMYRDHAPMLRRRAWRYLQDERAAEEVVQEAFLRVIQAAPQFSDDGHAIAYLSRTISNLCLNRLRDAGRQPRLVTIDDVTERLNEVSAQSHREHEFDLIAQERSELIHRAIGKLPTTQRLALVMYELDDRSFEQIAAELRIKPASVRTVLSRARATLRALLEEDSVSRDLRPALGDFGPRLIRGA